MKGWQVNDFFGICGRKRLWPNLRDYPCIWGNCTQTRIFWSTCFSRMSNCTFNVSVYCSPRHLPVLLYFIYTYISYRIYISIIGPLSRTFNASSVRGVYYSIRGGCLVQWSARWVAHPEGGAEYIYK
jgi:hypothetical protein